MKKIKTLKDALIHELKGLYDSERKFKKHLQRHHKAVYSKDLRNALTSYLESVETRINKLDWAFQYLDEKFAARQNPCISAILKENEKMIKNTISQELRDVVLTGCIQRVLHHNISVYGTCRALARELRMHDIEEILKDILTLEKEMDHRLSRLAMKEINDDAYAAELVNRTQ